MTITKIPGNVDEASAHLVLDRRQPILIRRRQVVVVVVVVVVARDHQHGSWIMNPV